MIALASGDARAALPDLQMAVEGVAGRAETSYEIAFLTYLGQTRLRLGDAAGALAATTRATTLFRARERRTLDFMMPPAHVWWWHREALRASGDRAGARRALAEAYGLVVETIGGLGDEGLRRSYLNKSDENRAIVRAWLDDASRRKLPDAQRFAHLRIESNVGEPFKRLVDTGMRLNELRSADELREFLIDEVTELSGAERVLLVHDTPDGRTIAGSLLPQGEDAAALLNTIAPWLDEAQRMRTVSLRHVPEGSDALDQRSCLVAPLVVQQRLLGYLYADLDGAFGRFHDTDRDLLGMLAAQAAVALDNAQWAQGLERKVEERTAQLDERVHELEIINGIQQGVGAELDFQAIVDLVGDKLREVFKTGDMSIRWWDEKANRIQQLYTYEHGVRLRLPASAVNADGPV
ncbi:MAG TPA: GAF domain-containing protein, partial [Casimicrobiaceae bacterium]|nr:GAF domain-containing protein [Casimicrobiaceae bacterium]